MRAVAAGLTDVGLQRDHNEDSFAILQDHELYIVADGMGGHRAGDVASKLATEAIVDFFRATAAEDFTWPFHFDSRMSEEENRLLTGIKIANRQIVERSSRSRECHGMGTTVVGALFSGKKGKMYIEDACRKLIALANEHGGEDNITAVLVKIEQEPGGEKVSLSDTLPTPLTARLRQNPAGSTAPAPAGPADAHADTPPAGDTKPKE